MMGVAVGQLLGEVYEGIEDWQRGDQQEALSHLLSVAENIALMGVFAGGQKVVGTLGRDLVRSHPAFFGQFTAIFNQAGKPRLWKPDLSPYEHDLPRGFTLAEGTEELHQIGSTEYGRVGHRILAGTFDSALRTWRLQHPGRPEAFSLYLNVTSKVAGALRPKTQNSGAARRIPSNASIHSCVILPMPNWT